MNGWVQVTLEDLADGGPHALATGPFGSAISSKHFVDDGVPIIRGSNLSLNVGIRLNDEGLAFLSEETAATFRRSIARRGDLVFTCWGTVGQVGLVDERCRYDEYVVSNKQMKLTPDPERVDSHFLYYLLSSPEMVSEVTGQAIGAAVPGFNLGQLRALTVRIPSLPEQREIAGVLRALDDLIEHNRRRVELLDAMARAIYREWFLRFRYPGHEGVPLVDSPFGPIPDGWTVAPLGSVATINRESRTPSQDEVVRYLDISALGERTVGQMSEINGDDAPGRARRVVQAGDVVWSMVRPNRRAHALLVEPGADWIASTGLAVLSPTGVSSTWLFEMASTQEFSDYLVSQEGGSAYPAVKPKDFERASVVVPTPELDCAFAQRVAPLHRLAWWLRSQSAALASMRDLLLPKLVTGEIDASCLDLDELTEAATA